MSKLISCIFVILLFTSCRKEEIPVPKPDLGSKISQSIELGSNYSRIAYFDLSTNQVVGESVKTNWDLGLSASSTTPHIILNQAKLMMAAASSQAFHQINDISAFNQDTLVDSSTGNLDSLALRPENGNVFIIDRGLDFSGDHLGYFKIEIIEHTSTFFKGKIANIDGSNEQIIELNKGDAYNYTFLKWNETTSVSYPVIEPLKSDWDLVFTQYTNVFHEPEFMPYMVVGCLINSHDTKALQISNKTFDEIKLDDALNLTLSNNLDVIGYDWKAYDFDLALYTVNSDLIYIIEDQDGYFYKLRFTGFYNDLGEKGTPTFEYQQL